MNFFPRRMRPVSLGWLFVPAIVLGQTTRTEPLSTVRDQIVIPELTAAEKRTVAEQAQAFLRDLYVHRYHKPYYYWGQSDPGVAIQKVVKDVDKLSTKELNLAIYRIFCAQRDLHLNYYFPAPHSLYTSFIPLTFARTSGRGNFFEVRVSAVNAQQFAQYAPGQRVPALGDQVISYNGKSVYLEVMNLLPITQGANPYGGFTRAIQNMTMLSHRRREVPKTNEVKLQLKAYRPDGKGEYYSITVPWLTQWVQPAAGLAPARMMREKEATPFVKRFNLGVDDFQQEYDSFIRQNQLEAATVYPSNPTGEPSLTWGKITNKDGNFGYLRLSSFSVDTTSVDFTIGEVRRLLMGELADTDGVIFDVRNNGGGYISLADKLPQLFSRKDAKVLGFRLLNNDLNWRIFNETPWGPSDLEFKRVVDEARGNGKTYTGTAQFTSNLDANLIGQVYYKPVVVMANARSYSATDMFTTSMQDNQAALILGEDPKTGAGGANVIEHPFYLFYGPSDVFKAMPPSYNMRVSWRQTIRFAPNAGKLIEDYGCDANMDISQTASDLVSGGATQLQRVTWALKMMSAPRTPSARGEQNADELYMSRGAVNAYGIFVKNTPSVQVFINDELRDQIPVNAGETEAPIRYTLPGNLASGQVARLTFVGVDRRGRTLWNLKRRITVLDEKVAVGSDGFSKDFATASGVAPLSIVNQASTPAQNGWNLVTPYLQLGYTPNYADNTDSDAILFLDLRGRTAAQLEFGMEFHTEEGWDFIEVQATNNITKKVLFSGSGDQAMERFTLDLSEFAGQDNVAIHFRFVSDSNTNAAGLRVSDVSVK